MTSWWLSIALGMLLQGGAVAALAARDRARSALLACVAELASPVLAFLVLPSLGLAAWGTWVVTAGLAASIGLELGFYAALIPSLAAGRAALVCVAGNVAGLWLSSWRPW